MAKQGNITKVLAFDQATAKTGYSVFQGENLLIEHGVIDLHKNKNTNERMMQMIIEIINIIQRVKPDAVVIEDVAMQSNAAALILLSRIQGAILGHCCIKDIRLMIIRPTEWRKLLGMKQGKGIKRPELKTEAKQYVLDRFGLQTTEDEADALCIGSAFYLTKE